MIRKIGEKMQTIHLRPGDLERDFGFMAALFTGFEDEPTSEAQLKEEYAEKRDRVTLKVAENEAGEALGFYWAARETAYPDRMRLYLIVQPERRGQGVGRQLYADALRTAQTQGVRKLRASVRDDSLESRAFADHRGFAERIHQFAMELDLRGFDDTPYEALIDHLKKQGFQFTTMAELGDTEEAQRKLYALNDEVAASTLGTDGEHSWHSFEDFQKSVCQAKWYRPDGQFVVIDSATGKWAAMSAITRFEGADYAYNLFTGVDFEYRGRRLAQAVKVLALRYARDVLNVDTVRTHHNTNNPPIIAIDLKFGYSYLPGFFTMEKIVE